MSAEKVAFKYGITRQECDDLAFESHRRCGLARDKGVCDRQSVPYQGTHTSREVYEVECIRYPPTQDGVQEEGRGDCGKRVADLRRLVGDPAGVGGGGASTYGLRVRARIISRVVVGSDPILMLDGVIPATRKALKRVGMRVAYIDLFEINEAFAVVPMAWRKTLGVDWNKVNVCGGACAHGHPLGATGCVLMTKLVNDLERTDARYGLQTMCIGWGMATATIIEKTNKVLPPRKDTLRARL